MANRSRSGRGTVAVTGIPDIPTFDPRASTGHQLGAPETLFGDLSRDRFLPSDRIDEDPVRADLDRRLSVDVLGPPGTLRETGGTIDLFRRKSAR